MDLPAALRGRIIELGMLDRDQIRAVYRHADLLAFVSLTEGFGLPVLEAMACGCPVLASTGGSLPTVVGNAARTVDPADLAGMSEALGELLTSPSERLRLRGAGLERARQFSWSETVRPLAQATGLI
jgi:glycosyltransferase involved in cell wall biosynthesis